MSLQVVMEFRKKIEKIQISIENLQKEYGALSQEVKMIVEVIASKDNIDSMKDKRTRAWKELQRSRAAK
jgi:intracellular sulfur oxidation DsrE/DsrF family protein